VKVRGRASPYDGNLPYWAQRLKDHPLTTSTLGRLLAQQQSKCAYCGLTFTSQSLIEIDHCADRLVGCFECNRWSCRGSERVTAERVLSSAG